MTPVASRLMFVALAVLAVAIGVIELIAWVLTSFGCLNGGAVLCYGPAHGNPAAPGYSLGHTLRTLGAVLAGITALISAIAGGGPQGRLRAATVALLVLLLVASTTLSVAGCSVLRRSPPSQYCKHIGGCFTD